MSAINTFMNAGDELDSAITELLQLSPFSATELAQKVGVSQPTVSRWNRGVLKPSMPAIVLVCEAIHHRVEEIDEVLNRLVCNDDS